MGCSCSLCRCDGRGDSEGSMEDGCRREQRPEAGCRRNRSNGRSLSEEDDVAVDCCSWDGIDCDDTGNRVVELSLPDRGLRGVIPSSLQSLNTLSLLNLSCNFLCGPLLDGLFSSMNNLHTIDVSYIRFSGQLPDILPPDILPPTIQSFNFSGNCFNDTIQAAFLQSTPSLIALNVNNNTFTGVIPSSISDNST
ncbi:unnamed protein product [Lactuca virosa]|uniref:Leucine-rich repeat-containing N-terminal plant-type domain-containing protein n=1 Tax=Lactuca virosa TaxID=75947 RepID=A0AAU9NGM4_9ASTR|nr:unnamed protein product [Lactuca virosa]